MSKLNIPLTYNSGTSSETSETPSIDENLPSESITSGIDTTPTQISGSKIPKTWKRMKDSITDPEAKRPPWRAVSISTLPKPDKNALLRAKLLDASRRLRKLTVGIQTDAVATKLMKDVSVAAQTGLVLSEERGIVTDGFFTQRRDGAEEYILTYSIAQMTDKIEHLTVSTQTLVPRYPPDAFVDAYIKRRNHIDEKQLLTRLSKLRNSAIPIMPHFHDNKLDAAKVFSNSKIDAATDTLKLQYKTTEAITSHHSPNLNTYFPKILYPTELSWHFEDDMNLIHKSNSSFTYTITPNNPLNSFLPLSPTQCQHFDINFLLLSFDELISETNRLVDFFENALKKRKRSSNLIVIGNDSNKSKLFLTYIPKFPSEYWLPIIEEQEKCLSTLKKNFKVNK